jgi:hypothetical protein
MAVLRNRYPLNIPPARADPLLKKVIYSPATGVALLERERTLPSAAHSGI